MTKLDEKPQVSDVGGDFGEDLEHWACPCSPDLAFCGADLHGAEYVEATAESPDDCVVCVELKDKTCPRCGL